MKHTLPILCLLLTSCDECQSWEGEKHVYILIADNDKLSDEQVDVLKQASLEWSEAIDHQLTFKFIYDDSYSNLITIHVKSAAEIDASNNALAYSTRQKYERGSDMTIPYDVNLKKLRLIMLHELGHALGCDHEADGTVMASHYKRQGHEITCDDVQSYCEANNCDAEQMRICQD